MSDRFEDAVYADRLQRRAIVNGDFESGDNPEGVDDNPTVIIVIPNQENDDDNEQSRHSHQSGDDMLEDDDNPIVNIIRPNRNNDDHDQSQHVRHSNRRPDEEQEVTGSAQDAEPSHETTEVPVPPADSVPILIIHFQAPGMESLVVGGNTAQAPQLTPREDMKRRMEDNDEVQTKYRKMTKGISDEDSDDDENDSHDEDDE